jgi:hypothetical protein
MNKFGSSNGFYRDDTLRGEYMKARHHITSSTALELEPEFMSHPQKIFWPDEGYTKLDLAKFYEGIFPALQPYLADRLLICERCPDGMRCGGDQRRRFPHRWNGRR